MAAKIASNSKIIGDTKNVTVNDTADAVLLSDEKSVAMEEEDKKGLKLNDEQPIKMKYETDVLNEVDNVLGSKASMSSLKIQKTTATASRKITIKKEVIPSNEESVLKTPTYTPTPIKLVKTVNVLASEVNSKNTDSVDQVLTDGNKKGGNMIRLSVKDLSDEERKKLRAKRFNIIVADSSTIAKKAITTKAPNLINKDILNSANNPTPSFDVLKKRAERFGENVSTVMKSLDHKEKMLKRKLKFLESVTNLKEVEIKKRRAERFRMV